MNGQRGCQKTVLGRAIARIRNFNNSRDNQGPKPGEWMKPVTSKRQPAGCLCPRRTQECPLYLESRA